jgi:hypothetical protein
MRVCARRRSSRFAPDKPYVINVTRVGQGERQPVATTLGWGPRSRERLPRSPRTYNPPPAADLFHGRKVSRIAAGKIAGAPVLDGVFVVRRRRRSLLPRGGGEAEHAGPALEYADGQRPLPGAPGRAELRPRGRTVSVPRRRLSRISPDPKDFDVLARSTAIWCAPSTSACSRSSSSRSCAR